MPTRHRCLPLWHAGAVSTPEPALDVVLAGVGPRLRALRLRKDLTLTSLSATTGISVSTLSRLESGGRKPTLELLLPIARAHGVALDELVGAPPVGDPRVRSAPVEQHGMVMWPLSNQPGGLQAYKLLVRPGEPRAEPEQKVHEGYDWLYVLSGRLRVVLGEHDLVLKRGEVAEFDTRTPHWFGAADDRPVELLALFSKQGERVHVRARPKGSA